jgi:hypothetical protein
MTLTALKAQEHTKDRLRGAQHRRRYVEVRRVAVIRPAGAHFKLRPIRVSLKQRRTEEQRAAPTAASLRSLAGRTTELARDRRSGARGQAT